MFKLPWELERPSVPAANPSTPRISDEPDQSEKRTKAKRKRKAVTFLREEEIDRLFSVIDSIRDRAIFRLAYHAGLRASEIGMLQLRDYDPKAAKILIAWRVSASILRRNAIWDPSGDQTGFVSSWGADVRVSGWLEPAPPEAGTATLRVTI